LVDESDFDALADEIERGDETDWTGSDDDDICFLKGHGFVCLEKFGIELRDNEGREFLDIHIIGNIGDPENVGLCRLPKTAPRGLQ
jgi:hypothetical protein